MIPLLVILLLGAGALAAYQFSSKTHAWVDDHVKAVRAALAAHDAAQAHLDESTKAPPGSPQAQAHAENARPAISEGADKVAEAAKTAKTAQQRAVAAQMALLTVALQDQAKAVTAIHAIQADRPRVEHQSLVDHDPRLLVANEQQLVEARQFLADAVERIRRARSALAELGVR